jgi:hypothetical protein
LGRPRLSRTVTNWPTHYDHLHPRLILTITERDSSKLDYRNVLQVILMMVPAHGIDMNQATATRSEDRHREPPSVAVSLALGALTVGLVVLVSVIATAPAVVGAFGAGVATAVLVTAVHRVHAERSDARGLAERRATHR